MQINQVFTSLLPGLHLRSATVYGGVGFRPQENALRGGGFTDRPLICSPWLRIGEAPGKLTYTSGARPVRSIAPD